MTRTPDEARASVARAKGSLADAGREIVAQVANRDWLSLGYRDWDHMREAEYGGTAVIVPRKDRPELVAALRAQGLTQQQTADTLGVGRTTVRDDLHGNGDSAVTDLPMTRVDSMGRTRPTTYTRQPLEGTVVEDVLDLPAPPEPVRPLRPEETSTAGASIALGAALPEPPPMPDQSHDARAQDAIVLAMGDLARRLDLHVPHLSDDTWTDVNVLAARDVVQRLTNSAATWLRVLNARYAEQIKKES